MKHTIITAAILLAPLLVAARKDTDTTTGRTAGNASQLAGVTIRSSSTKQKQLIESTQMGKVDISTATLLKVPAIAGEADIIKALQLTPGVKRGTEGAIGMYVRGGGNDENLVLLDGAPIYNAGHLLGFFSVFNNTTIRDVQLYKSSFPAQYGGRLSSVLDVRTKDASLNDYHAQATVGTISSAVNVQLPIVKDRLSIMLAGRRTYIDQVMRSIPYHFYDLNGKMYFLLNKQNRFYISSYVGNDILRSNGTDNDNPDQQANVRTGMVMGNRTMAIRWNHLSADSKVGSDVSVFSTGFRYNISGNSATSQLSVRSAINDIGFKADLRSSTVANHKITSGVGFSHHYFNPNVIASSGPDVSVFGNSDGKKINSYEAAVYINDEYRISPLWLMSAGIRFSGMGVDGKAYFNPEPRIGLRYLLSERSSFKLSYAHMAQYMHLVSNSSVVLPTDMWYPVTATVKPGKSDQVSAGYYYTIPGLDVSISTEVYYKHMKHLIEYHEGAMVIMNNDYEKELVTGKGRSYGCELFINKTAGKFTGWVGYSLSYAHRRFDSLNNGREYFARYDRRHDFSFVGLWDINKRWSVGTTVVYATGSPFTGQTTQYVMPSPGLNGFEALFAYTGRNAMRMSASFRTDCDLQYKFNLGKRIKGDAHLSMYNVFNRTQPSQVARVWDDATHTYKYEQKGLFGTITALALNLDL